MLGRMFSKATAKQQIPEHNSASSDLAKKIAREEGSTITDKKFKESDPKVSCSSIGNDKLCVKRTSRSKCDTDVDVDMQSTSVSKRTKLEPASPQNALKSMPHMHDVKNKTSSFGSGEVAASAKAMGFNKQNKCFTHA